jgi:hypothetical protein
MNRVTRLHMYTAYKINALEKSNNIVKLYMNFYLKYDFFMFLMYFKIPYDFMILRFVFTIRVYFIFFVSCQKCIFNNQANDNESSKILIETKSS